MRRISSKRDKTPYYNNSCTQSRKIATTVNSKNENLLEKATAAKYPSKMLHREPLAMTSSWISRRLYCPAAKMAEKLEFIRALRRKFDR